jgi:hypothetical protein
MSPQGKNMSQNIVPISLDQHRHKKIKPITRFDFAKDFNLASIMVHEFSRASSIYPIVFLENKELDEFRPVVLLGLESNTNLFIKDGVWDASYIPAIIRRYPFALARVDETSETFTVCLDNDSDLISDDEGTALFNEDGEPEEMMERVKQYLSELQQMERFTQEFCHFLREQNLFTPLNMKVRQGDEVKDITGCYVINEERLNNFSNDTFLKIRERNFLPPIYAHLISLAQIERLLKLDEENKGVTEDKSDKQQSNVDNSKKSFTNKLSSKR